MYLRVKPISSRKTCPLIPSYIKRNLLRCHSKIWLIAFSSETMCLLSRIQSDSAISCMPTKAAVHHKLTTVKPLIITTIRTCLVQILSLTYNRIQDHKLIYRLYRSTTIRFRLLHRRARSYQERQIIKDSQESSSSTTLISCRWSLRFSREDQTDTSCQTDSQGLPHKVDISLEAKWIVAMPMPKSVPSSTKSATTSSTSSSTTITMSRAWVMGIWCRMEEVMALQSSIRNQSTSVTNHWWTWSFQQRHTATEAAPITIRTMPTCRTSLEIFRSTSDDRMRSST